MSRPPWIVANWKMNLTAAEAESLAHAVAAHPACGASARVTLAPPFPYLERIAHTLAGSAVALAGQDLDEHESGAFTGAVSGRMLRDVGARHVLVGHSERRHAFGEDDGLVRRKIGAAVAAGLTPLVCVGETLEQRDGGRADEVVAGQVRSALQAEGWARGDGDIVVAYEPVWAIGTGRVAGPGQASAIHALVRDLLPPQALVLYGGSVNPGNARDLLAEPEIDGLLVGGASLSAESFGAILAASQPS